jgi:SAM-dependent methyltransferase
VIKWLRDPATLPHPLKINLACGTDVKPDFCNLDIVERWPLAARACDCLWDATKDKLPFADGTVSECYCGYTFLHIAERFHAPLLADIRRALVPGGRLVIGEVDYEVLLPRWLANPEDEYLTGLVFGEQGTITHTVLSDTDAKTQLSYESYDKHCRGFVERSLRAFMTRGGFRDVRRIWIHAQPAVFYELTLEARK